MFENNFKFCREDLGLTQEKLGNILGVKGSTISGWETSRDPIPLTKLTKFCNLYNLSLDFVVGLSRKEIKYNKIKLDKKEIGNRLKMTRKNLHLTQIEFSNKCGLAQTTYSHYEVGLNLITTTNAYAICKTYNISLDYLVGRTVKEKTSTKV